MAVSRACFFGDGTVLGCGDDALVGWPGRLVQEARRVRRDFVCYNLGVRFDTSADVRARWRGEASRRLPQPDGGVVFCFGLNDMASREDGTVRVSLDQSLGHAQAIMTEVKAWRPALWISPLPVIEDSPQQAVRLYKHRNTRSACLNEAFRGVAEAIGIPYLDAFDRLSGDPLWTAALGRGDGIHPDAGGYGYLAALIGEWPAWRAWVARPQAAAPDTGGAVRARA